MRVSAVCIVALAAVALSCAGVRPRPAPAAWAEAGPAGSGVTALFPGRPRQERGGDAAECVLEADGGRRAYVLLVSDPGAVKVDLGDRAAVRRILATARDAAAKELNGEVLSERDVELNGLPGREVVVRIPGGAYRSRAYLTGTRSVHSAVSGPEDFCKGADADKFLGSVRIKE